MSSCLSGGGRAIRLDLDLIRSPSTSWTSYSSSPSSTLSESSNSPVTITTRKPRTPRKRPNQTYNEAAAILSTAYPKIFSNKELAKPGKFSKPCNPFAYEVEDLLLPFQFQCLDHSGFLLHPPRFEKPNVSSESKVVNSCERLCQSPGEINSTENFLDFGDEFREDFDAESILDEEIEEGIDSIMGDITEKSKNESMDESKNGHFYPTKMMNTCYGYPVGMGYHGNFIDNTYEHGLRKEASRNVDFWRFASVNVTDIITPQFSKLASEKKKKKKVEKIVELKNLGKGNSSSSKETKGKDNLIKKVSSKEEEEDEEVNTIPKPNAGLLLKLDYDVVLSAWSGKATPLPEELMSSDGSANDVQTRLSKIDLFTEGGGIREASVMRYKEKRRTRLFSKKIRYQVRKVNADQRPRMKGRFVRRPNSPNNEHQ